MNLSERELRFLTALAREHNQTGCRGPAHDLLRLHVYPNAPTSGAGSLAYAYEAVPLFGVLLRDFTDLQSIHDFLHKSEKATAPEWAWTSANEYLSRLAEARGESAPQGRDFASAAP